MAARGAKSSPVLIVFLVVFILAALILGVTTYIGYDGQAAREAAKKKADDDKNAAENDSNWYQFQALTFKAYQGYPLSKEEQENLAKFRKDFGGGQAGQAGSLVTKARDKNKDENAKIIREKLDQNYGWNDAETKAAKTLQDQFTQMTKELTDTKKQLADTKADNDKNRAALAAAQKELEGARATYDKDLKEAQAKADADLKKYLDQNNQLQKDKEELGKDKEKLSNDLAALKAENEKGIQAYEKQKKDLEGRVEKAEMKIAPVNIFQYDKPKGKIDSIVGNGRMPFINIGSADFVKPQLTFSVYGVGIDGKPITHDILGPDDKPIISKEDGKPLKEGKATIEVVSVLGPHLSQARVTSLRDEGRDPILRGDLLYNPAWSPTQRQHVAITGQVDLTGDGNNDMAEFLRTLEGQGVVVDAWLDIKDQTVKGKGMNRQTDYLILAYRPEEDFAKDKESAQARRARALGELMDKMQDQAVREGVTIISLRKFLALTGYQVPRGTRATIPPNFGSGAPPAGTKEPPKGDKESPKGDKEPPKGDKEPPKEEKPKDDKPKDDKPKDDKPKDDKGK
jgi:hypothetical protein